MSEIKEGSLTIVCSEYKVTIQVKDERSRTKFLEIEVDPKDFVAALGRLAEVPVRKMEVRHLDRVGKTRESQPLTFSLGPEHKIGYGDERENMARKIAKELTPEGWEAQMYFNSQDSFFRKDGEMWARTSIVRWI